MDKMLVTGASGFIGSYIVEEALRRGMEVWAGVRRTSSRRYLTDPRVNFIELDLGNPDLLKRQLTGRGFDYIVHAAGVTKCLRKDDFRRVNFMGTKNLVDAILATDMPIKRFIFISSLSVFGAIRERQPYQDITENDLPRPNTAYGKSKLEAERYLDSIGNDFPYIILRLTGVYGPRETDYFLMVKSIARHVDFGVGYRRQDITFVHVDDVVQTVFLSLDRGISGRKYFITDGEVYSSKDFSRIIKRELQARWVLRVVAPVWLLRVVTFFCGRISRMTGKPATLNTDKYHILRQRNWRCDIEPTADELGFHPTVKLDEGVAATVAWYKEHQWI